MNPRIFYLPVFVKQIQKLRGKEAEKTEQTLLDFDRFINGGQKSAGLGFKKIGEDKFEIRVDLQKRIVMKKIGSDYYMAVYGDHSEVDRFLKRQ